MKKYLTMAGGAATILAMFLPFTSVFGISINGLKMGGAGWFYIIAGLGIVAIGYLDKKGFYAAGIIAGALIALLSMKYQSDVKRIGESDIGIGLWLLLAAGLITIVGCVIGFLSKRKAPTVELELK
jgi:hypothetical protein